MSVRSHEPVECETANRRRERPRLCSLDFSDSVSFHCTQLPLLVLKPLPISCQDLRAGSFSVTGSARETQIPSVSWNNSFLVKYLDWLALGMRQPDSVLSTSLQNCESQMSSAIETGFGNTWAVEDKWSQVQGPTHQCNKALEAIWQQQTSDQPLSPWLVGREQTVILILFLLFLFSERIWRKSESCVREKHMSCGRHDSKVSCGHANNTYLSVFWSSKSENCFYFSHMSTMSHLKPPVLFFFPQCCLLPTPARYWFPRRQAVAPRNG